jgi:signal transduction histidine kinase/ActR/RegA family two-component response regulator
MRGADANGREGLSVDDLLVENASLRAKIDELEAALEEPLSTMEAIREGLIDAVVIDRDTTPQVMTLESANEMYLRFVQRAAKVGTWQWDLETGALNGSETFWELLGEEPRADATFELWESHIPYDERQAFATSVKAAIEKDTPFCRELRVESPAAESRCLDVRGCVLHSVDGLRHRLVGICLDITERKRAETDRAQLLERERAARATAENATRLKDQFLAMLSHELRTPISTILVWARMLLASKYDPKEQIEGLKVIAKSAEAQTQLLDDLLDTSRIASGKVRLELTETDMLEVVKLAVDATTPLAKSKGVDLRPHLPNDIGLMEADPDRLRQVVGNLLNNAVKFTPAGGRVDVRLSQDDKWIELTVADTGKGIDAEFLPSVFTAFSQADASSTRSFGGLGLGLAISKELVELHGGTIHAMSEGSDKGATFVVRLPLKGSERTARAKTKRDSVGFTNLNAMRGRYVLVVEDEELMRDALYKLLTNNHAKVIAVGTAWEAMVAFEKSRPDIIVSDIGLPKEDGYQLLQRIRTLEMERNEPPTPAIALTAFASNKDRRTAREVGFHKHVAKPVAPAALIAAIATLLADKERAINEG